MHKAWLGYKRNEWESHCYHVSDWETVRYLKQF